MNQELKTQIIEFIKRNPNRFNVDCVYTFNEKTQTNEFCIAGLAILLDEFDGDEVRAVEWFENGDDVHIGEYASRLLNCSQDLFYRYNWPENLFEAFDADKPIQTLIKLFEYYD